MSTTSTESAFTDADLSPEFFATALRNGLRCTDVTVIDLALQPGTKPGDNFCSDIYRARVSYRRAGQNQRDDPTSAPIETVSLIVKVMPFSAASSPMLEDLQVFDKEVHMYSDTMPRMRTLLGGQERLCAHLFYAIREPVQIIVFEDLRAAGFVMADRTAGLDEAHCELVLRKLGRFHAASVRLAEEDAEAMKLYNFGIVKPDALQSPVMDAVMVGGAKAVAELVGTWPGFEAVARKLAGISVNFLAKVDRVCNRTEPLYRVLNHGDMWVNNMLFKYEEEGAQASGGRPVDVCFVDFQMSVYDSPGHDLNYFLNTSPQNRVREERRQHVVQVYHETFERTLQELRSPQAGRLTMEMLRSELRARELYGLMAAVGILPLVLMQRDGEKTATLDGLADAEQAEKMKRERFYNPNYVTAIRAIVQRFEEVGVLDGVPEV